MHRIAVLTGLFVLGAAFPALADAIDGDWCNDGGKHFRITGPSIQLNSGTTISGEYSRHAFHYVGPAGDPEEGSEVQMGLRGEHELSLQRIIKGETGPMEDWRRCSTVS